LKQGSVLSDGLFDEHNEETEQRSAIRMITLFRPHGWYNHTKEKLEEVVLHWQILQGCHTLA
jgi:hypothetical protein